MLQPHYIVATFDPISLRECKRLNLPCFDATIYSQRPIEDGDHGFGSAPAVAIWCVGGCWGSSGAIRN